jgi:hypothetical protein
MRSLPVAFVHCAWGIFSSCCISVLLSTTQARVASLPESHGCIIAKVGGCFSRSNKISYLCMPKSPVKVAVKEAGSAYIGWIPVP